MDIGRLGFQKVKETTQFCKMKLNLGKFFQLCWGFVFKQTTLAVKCIPYLRVPLEKKHFQKISFLKKRFRNSACSKTWKTHFWNNTLFKSFGKYAFVKHMDKHSITLVANKDDSCT